MQTFSAFLRDDIDAIIEEFETFARISGPTAAMLSDEDLRDHARIVLLAIAEDLETEQTSAAQFEKAQGRGVAFEFSDVRSTARQHAQHRFEEGFLLPQMVSEYRALRASVIRRWEATLRGSSDRQVQDLIRFGEAIDEALTEAIDWYSRKLENSRALLIGVLAHDLRAPLSAVRMSADYLLRLEELKDGALRAATRISTSTTRMAGYVSDLLDFTQTLLGAGLPIVREPMELPLLCADVVDELRSAYPNAFVNLEIQATLAGTWDSGRLSQLISNLVKNAIIHGDPSQPVSVIVGAMGSDAIISVHNWGTPIPTEAMNALFQPLAHRRRTDRGIRDSSGLGLGLYIAREIAIAHSGDLEVVSTSEGGTRFTANLPSGEGLKALH